MTVIRIIFYVIFLSLAYIVYSTDDFTSKGSDSILFALPALMILGFGMIFIMGIKGNLHLPWQKPKTKKK